MARSSDKKSATPRYRITKAVVRDVPSIKELIDFYASRDLMLHRALNEIYESLRDYWVCEKQGKIVGCAALHVD